MTGTLKPTPAEMYEKVFVPALFGPVAHATFALLPPASGGTILDLACGTGIVARLAAPLTGPRGRIVGIDLRPGMVAAARNLPPPTGAAVEFREGTATRLDFPPGTFDQAYCQAGFQYFDHRLAAAREVRRVLRRGGQLAASVWRALDEHPMFSSFATSEERHLGALGVSRAELLAPFSLADAGELAALFREAGFGTVDVYRRSLDVRFPSAATFVADMEFGFGAVIPQFVADPSAFDRFVAEVTRETADLVRRHTDDAGGVVFQMHANIAVVS